ncbi:MAG: hypothetical protein MJ139_05120, partial [Limosilactobacillus sp.]|nr:hypothetical protein [Limosilactobacillus sp.]
GGTNLKDLTDAKFVRLGNGFTGATFAGNETTISNTYLNDDGFGSTDVVGKRFTFAFTGVRMAGDPAQEFIASLQMKLGTDLETRFLIVAPDGKQKVGVISISALVPQGGNSNAGATMSFTINVQGKLYTLATPIPVTTQKDSEVIDAKVDGLTLDGLDGTDTEANATVNGSTPTQE